MSNCSSRKIFVGDIGTVLRLYGGEDLTGASLVIKAKSPSSVTKSWTASVDPNNEKYAIYATIADDFNEDGEWLLSLEVTYSITEKFIGQTEKVIVYNQFEDIE